MSDVPSLPTSEHQNEGTEMMSEPSRQVSQHTVAVPALTTGSTLKT